MSLVSKKIFAAGITILVLAALWWFTAGTLGSGSFFGRYSGRMFVANVAISYAACCVAYLLWPGVWHRKRVFRIAGATIGLFSALVILELPTLMGLIDYRKIIKRPFHKPWAHPDTILEKDFIFRRHPNDHFSGLIRGDLVNWLRLPSKYQFDVDVQYDRFGFRNPINHEHAEILVIGDSFVEATNVPLEEIGSSQIAKQLDATVMNLGLSGYGPSQELAVLRQIGFDRKPRVVVWMWFDGNDAPLEFEKYERFNENWPAFVREHHGFVAKSFSSNFMKWLARTTTPKYAYEFKANRQSGLLGSDQANDLQRMYFGYNPEPFSPDDSAIVDRAMDVVGTAAKECQDKGIKFLLVFAPAKFRVYSDICQWEETSHCKNWTCNNMPDRMGTWAQQQGISYLDLTPHFKSAAKDSQPVYELEDTHWTPAGQGLFAQQAAEFIQQAGWLSERL